MSDFPATRLTLTPLQLERTNGDKLKIRCIELDEELSDAVAGELLGST